METFMDTVSAQLNTIEKVLVVFWHLNEEMLNIMPLKLEKLKYKNYDLWIWVWYSAERFIGLEQWFLMVMLSYQLWFHI